MILAVVFLALVQFGSPIAGALLRAWYVLPVMAVGAGVTLVARWQRRAATERARAVRLASLRLTLEELDALDPTGFELAVRDLMVRDGIAARHVGQQGDQAADAIGKDTIGRTFVAQCKHTTSGGRVTSRVMYEVNGTAGPAHGADIAVVVTNGTFTRDARAWGDRHRVYWIDRDRLRQWAEDGASLQRTLRLPARSRPRRPASKPTA
ncbi:restriction endonuclease [Streptomyces tailanensis]|uniref:restriction endonuclease n=1 Tax=Streptomyces tailanensis TaxID=2569858 RepID=UPI001FE4AC5B|nr:restriction endonuclease [Streptomyces tailanensis]